MGFGNIDEFINDLLELKNSSITIVCGSNKRLYKRLSKIDNSNLKVVGYSHHINDFHLADSFSDLFAVPAMTFLLIAIDKDFGKYTIGFNVIMVCIFLILYEFLLSAITDGYDMIAVIVSGVFTWLILRLAMKK